MYSVIEFSALRLNALIHVNLTSIDLSWNFTDTLVWSAAEVNIAVVSVCLPTLRPLYTFVTTGSFHRHETPRMPDRSSPSSYQTANSRAPTTGTLERKWPTSVPAETDLDHGSYQEADRSQTEVTSVSQGEEVQRWEKEGEQF
jgi:hypothetical protein